MIIFCRFICTLSSFQTVVVISDHLCYHWFDEIYSRHFRIQHGPCLLISSLTWCVLMSSSKTSKCHQIVSLLFIGVSLHWVFSLGAFCLKVWSTHLVIWRTPSNHGKFQVLNWIAWLFLCQLEKGGSAGHSFSFLCSRSLQGKDAIKSFC